MANEEHKAYPIRSSQDPRSSAVSLTGIELDTYRVFRGNEGGAPTPNDAGGGGISLRDILYALFRHKWKIVTFFVLFSVGAALFVSQSVDTYTSESRIFVKGDRAELSIDPAARGDSFLAAGRAGADMRSEVAIIQSRAVAEMAVDDVKPAKILSLETSGDSPEAGVAAATDHQDQPAAPASEPPPASSVAKGIKSAMDFLRLSPPNLGEREKAITVLSKSLDVKPSATGSTLLIVTYTAYDPKSAQEILKSVIDNYQVKHIEINKTKLSPAFFEKESTRLKTDLEAKEGLLAQRKKDLNIASLETEKDLGLNQLSTLQTSLLQTETEINALEAEMKSNKRILDATDSEIAGGESGAYVDPALEDIRRQLNALKAKEIEMSKRYKPSSRDMKDLHAQMEGLEALLNGDDKKTGAKTTHSRNPAKAQLAQQYDAQRAKLEGLLAKKSTTKGEIEKQQKVVENLSGHEKELTTLEREVALLRTKLSQVENSAQAAAINSRLDENNVSNVSVLQEASMPLVSEKSQRKMLAILAFGIFMGIASGVGLAFVLEFFDHSFKTSEEIEKTLGLPVLASLPHVRGHRPEAREEIA